jgi:hypothetical protein
LASIITNFIIVKENIPMDIATHSEYSTLNKSDVGSGIAEGSMDV